MDSHFNNGNRTSDDGGWVNADNQYHTHTQFSSAYPNLIVCVRLFVCLIFDVSSDIDMLFFSRTILPKDYLTIDARCILRCFSIFILYLCACVALYNLRIHCVIPIKCECECEFELNECYLTSK